MMNQLISQFYDFIYPLSVAEFICYGAWVLLFVYEFTKDFKPLDRD